MNERKQALRERIWAALQVAGVARFPGAVGRIPNFAGAEQAATRIAQLDIWQCAHTIKSNPDLPQRPVRHAALTAGKTVYVAVPRLANEQPFLELDPARLDPRQLWKASSIKGAFALGRPVSLDEMRPIDLIVTGCVALTRGGARLGKGGGYSDLEYALAREVGLVGPEAPIVTTAHPLQIVGEGEIPMASHDISLDWIATPDELIETRRMYPRPPGVLWEALEPEKVAAIPVLQRMASTDARRAQRINGYDNG
ncbi:MAG: hypothetical protein M5U01_13210 [Ardenticatenaceae bacterium]|nr:hypothetical protein [Ardenticatenaceae bacterium]HBY96853.1 5-formyltetrahydrofolate cyclo-ligase [Chloroflexota bacterium]